MKTRGFIPLLVIALFASLTTSCAAQWGPWPAWASQKTVGGVEAFAYLDHPALLGIPERWRASVTRGLQTMQLHRKYPVWYSQGHGELAFGERMAQGGMVHLGALTTGLEYVFSVDPWVSQGGPQGLVVAGVDASGRSKVLFAAWPSDTITPQSLVLTPLTPDSLPGRRYVSASIVFGKLYVFDAATSSIIRFVDTDGNGLPDAIDSIPPFDLAGTPTDELGVFGFYPYDASTVGVYYGIQLHNELRGWKLLEINGQFDIIEATTPVVNGGKPGILGRVAAGLKVLRVLTEPGNSVTVYAGPPSNLSPVGEAKNQGWNRIVDVPLSRALVAGELVEVRTNWGEVSYQVQVGPTTLVVFPGTPGFIRSGSAVQLDGGNLTPGTTVTATLDGHPVPCTVLFVNSSRIVVGKFSIPEGQTAAGRLRLEIADPAFQETVIRDLNVIPAP